MCAINGGTVKLSNMTDADKKLISNLHGLESVDDLDNSMITGSDKGIVFKRHRRQFVKDNSLDWKKMFMADQNNKDGSYFEGAAYIENGNGKTR